MWRAGPLAWLATVSLVFVLAYRVCNHLTSLRQDVGRGVFDWERAIPFVEWTIVPYLSICAFFALSFFVDCDRDRLAQHAARLLLALVLALVCYAAFPLRFTFERPPTTGWTGWLFGALAAFDLPYNRAPSLHISVLTILWVRFAPWARGWRGGLLHAWFAAIAASVLTTYQHHVIDVPAGLAVGALCIACIGGRRSRQAAAGSTMLKRAPPSARLLATMRPPIAASDSALSARPRPRPLPSGLVVKKGSNSRALTSALRPGPLSSTWSST